MLDVSLNAVRFHHPKYVFSLHDITLTIPASTHTAVIGPAAGGASTLLSLLAGEIRPDSGEILLGTRVINKVKPKQRPLLHVRSRPDVPGRWSVQHVLVNAVRGRSLDRTDRHHEYALAVQKWSLGKLLARRVSTLSSSEETVVQLARIELMRPAVLIADRLLERLSPAELPRVADQFYRTLRVLGTTVISAPSSILELGYADKAVVLSGGRVVQQGAPREVWMQPVDEAAAEATGEVNVVPVTIRGTTVDSIIGSWETMPPPFQGTGVALVRPDAFQIAAEGEESDLIFGVEEASFHDGRWHVSGVLSGAMLLRVVLPGSVNVHKGRLFALRYDTRRIRLLPRELPPVTLVPTDVVPALEDSR